MKRTWGEYIATIAIAVILAVLVRTFVFTAYKVPTGSMRPTLLPGDFVFANKLAYHISPGPERGDLVVFESPQQPGYKYIKRVIALEGDRVEIRKGFLFVNGKPASYELIQDGFENPNPEAFQLQWERDEYGERPILLARQDQETDFAPLVVPPGELFLLGDNRDTSEDSRYWGTVPSSSLLGRVSLIWFSVDIQSSWAGGRFPQLRTSRIFKFPQ